MTLSDSSSLGRLSRFSVVLSLGLAAAAVGPQLLLVPLGQTGSNGVYVGTGSTTVPAVAVGLAAVALDWEDPLALRDVAVAAALGATAQVLVALVITLPGTTVESGVRFFGDVYDVFEAALVGTVTAYAAATQLPIETGFSTNWRAERDSTAREPATSRRRSK